MDVVDASSDEGDAPPVAPKKPRKVLSASEADLAYRLIEEDGWKRKRLAEHFHISLPTAGRLIGEVKSGAYPRLNPRRLGRPKTNTEARNAEEINAVSGDPSLTLVKLPAKGFRFKIKCKILPFAYLVCFSSCSW